MKLRIEVEDYQVRAAFARMIVAGKDLGPALDTIGNDLAQSTKLRFVSGSGPDGSPWKPVLRGGRPLRDTGTHLMNAVSYRATRQHVDVGVPAAWGVVHQFGARIKAKTAPYLRFKIGNRWASKKQVTIPARPFLGVSDEDRKSIIAVLHEHLTGIRV